MRSMSLSTCGVFALKGENTEVRPGALRGGDKLVGSRPPTSPAPLPILDAHGKAAAGADAGHRGAAELQ